MVADADVGLDPAQTAAFTAICARLCADGGTTAVLVGAHSAPPPVSPPDPVAAAVPTPTPTDVPDVALVDHEQPADAEPAGDEQVPTRTDVLTEEVAR